MRAAALPLPKAGGMQRERVAGSLAKLGHGDKNDSGEADFELRGTACRRFARERGSSEKYSLKQYYRLWRRGKKPQKSLYAARIQRFESRA